MKRQRRDSEKLESQDKEDKPYDEPEASGSEERRHQKKKKSLNSLPKASWSIPEVLSESYKISLAVSEKFISMVSEECTLPFLARYRKEDLGNIGIEDLRRMKATVEELKQVQGKIQSVIKRLEDEKLLTEPLLAAICSTKDLEELETYEANCTTSKEAKKSLAARAIELGIEGPALKVLNGKDEIKISALINPSVEGLKNEKDVELGLQHIIAAVIGKDDENVAVMDSLVKTSRQTTLKVSKSKSVTTPKPDDVTKFEDCIGKCYNVKSIQSHVVMKLNRGKSYKVLAIKVDFPADIKERWIRQCKEKYSVLDPTNSTRNRIVEASIVDAYDRIVEPHFTRRIQSQLTKTAHLASIDNFARNLRNLLLTPPLTDTTVLGLDPGFKHGCKCAAVAPGGTVLHTEIIKIPFSAPLQAEQPAVLALKKIILDFKCYTIALGNGTACRETEQFLSDLIKSGCFSPHDVKYTIINEAGSSAYSCSPEAKAEFPTLDPNVISAVSLARRLQDPLTEYVRVPPQHLGIGMYQHDIPVKKLEVALEEVVIECVSFVGVDLNTCPLHVLSKVAGLSQKKAQKIIEHRTEHGLFVNRQQLLDVSSLGPKTFEQCSGFLRIMLTKDGVAKAQQASVMPKGKKILHELEPLDRTAVHPESYPVARNIIEMFRGDVKEVGHENFTQRIKRFISANSLEKISNETGAVQGVVQQILEALSQTTRYDVRATFARPIFRSGITSVNDLKVGQFLDGQILTVMDFGAFVDIGVGRAALLHVSNMKGIPLESLIINSRVTVKVVRLETDGPASKHRINVGL